jgi:hypothetical protein
VAKMLSLSDKTGLLSPNLATFLTFFTGAVGLSGFLSKAEVASDGFGFVRVWDDDREGAESWWALRHFTVVRILLGGLSKGFDMDSTLVK